MYFFQTAIEEWPRYMVGKIITKKTMICGFARETYSRGFKLFSDRMQSRSENSGDKPVLFSI